MTAARVKSRSTGKAHRFGGDWTSSKLDVLAAYLASYTKALKATPFKKAYIDAFAGTGYRTLRGVEVDSSPSEPLFPDLAEAAPQGLLDGSARLALKVTPQFDRYIFIERDSDRCAQLQTLREEFPDLREHITVSHGDANQSIRDICEKNWSGHRAVLFLDPYGMQVEWETIEAIASTKAIDLWLLFPLGIGVNRLLTKSGNIPTAWRKRLDTLLGTTDWYDEFYSVKVEKTLFGTEEERVVKATMTTIGRYFVERLKTVFAGVAEEPGVLRNSSNCPLYLLCFAAASDKGAPIAIKIAKHLLKELR